MKKAKKQAIKQGVAVEGPEKFSRVMKSEHELQDWANRVNEIIKKKKNDSTSKS